MIEISGLRKSFGEKVVFNCADIRIDKGGICGLVGINGAGKSTLLRIISGVMQADGGSVTVDGERVYDNEKIKRRIFFLPDDPYYDSNVTGEKLRALYKTFYKFDDNVFNSLTGVFALNTKKPIRNFSKGMKRQMFISAALACDADLLLLDEAFDGLDPLARLEVKQRLKDFRAAGGTVIIASHSLRELEDICDSFILIDNTTVKVSGNIISAMDNVVKLQLVFEGDVKCEDLPFEYIRADKVGKVITVIARGKKEKLEGLLADMRPVVMEEIPMNFEEMFIEEVNGRGYLK